MSKKDILKLTENQYLINAIQLYEKHYGKDENISEISIRYKNLSESYNKGILSINEYREKKIGLAIALHKYISESLSENELSKVTIMNLNIQHQTINGQVNMADVINMGGNASNVVLDKADTELMKVVNNVEFENKEQVINAINNYNSTQEPLEKTKSKNKITSFITENCMPALKMIGKTALAIILTKYGMKLADLGLED